MAFLAMLLIELRTKEGTQIFLLVRKSANFWAQSAIANTQIFEVCLSVNLKSAHDQSANRKSVHFLGVPGRKSANLQGKSSVSEPDPHWFALNTFFFYLRKNI
jgi:hypothetical protein